MQHTSAHARKPAVLLTPKKINKYKIQNRPFCVVAQYLVESPEIVGGVVYDFLRVGNADVDCIHYLGGEVTPVERLRDRSQRDNAEEYK